MTDAGPRVMTVGHSTRPLGESLDLLEEHGCRTVVDVRSLPRSRRYPHFDREALAAALTGGGSSTATARRSGACAGPCPPDESVNRGLRNERFRAYADHMQTAEFAEAVVGSSTSPGRIGGRSCAPRPFRGAATDPCSPTRWWPGDAASSTSSTGTGPKSTGSARRPWSRTGRSRIPADPGQQRLDL